MIHCLWLAVTLAVLPAVVHGQAPAAKRVAGAPTGITAFVDVAVVPMDTELVLPHQTVLVEGGWITTLGPASQVKVPTGAVQIDGRGKYLMPGLVDMHMHLLNYLGDSTQTEYVMSLYLANGVTTVRNMDWVMIWSNNREEVAAKEEMLSKRLLQLRARSVAGEGVVPRIYTSGRWLGLDHFSVDKYGQEKRQPGAGLQIDPAEVAGQLAAYKAAGYDFVKAYFEAGAIFDSLIAVARRLDMPVAGHVPLGVTIEYALAARMHSIEHFTGYIPSGSDSLSDSRIQELVEATKRAGVWNCPTIGHFHGNLVGGRHVPALNRLIKALQDAGAGLLLGTDVGGGGLPLGPAVVHKELQALMAAGLTPYQALVTGTRNPAAYFGTLKETGTVTTGKRADLVLLNGNPLADISQVVQPAGVMLGGRWLSREVIDRRVFVLAPAVEYAQAIYKELIATTSTLASQAHYASFKVYPQLKPIANELKRNGESEAGRRRHLLSLVGQRLAAYRAGLPPAQQSEFDRRARAWIAERKLDGHAVTIAGVAE